EATAQARLLAEADRLPAAEVVRRADALAAAPWPGASDSALWLAEWLHRSGRFTDAQARYLAVVAKWPDSHAAKLALRGAAGCAIDAGDWDRAEAIAAQLPTIEPSDRAVHDE